MWRSPVDANRPADQLSGDGVLPALMRDQSEEMQGVGMAGIEQQYLAVEAIRFDQASRLMVPSGFVEQFLDA
jgi:hypothetical protein